MDAKTLLLIVSVTLLVVVTGIFLWLSIRSLHPKVSPVQKMPQKENFSSQISFDSRPFNSSQISFDSRPFNSSQISSDSRPFNSSQISSDSRPFNSPEGWQRSRKNFDSPSLSSQVLLDPLNTNTSRPELSSSPYNSRSADAKPQISPSGTRSIEHYEQCIHVSYEPRIDGISLIFKDTVITNAIEVDNVFAVCERKFKEVMRARGWKRVGWVADLGGYNLVGTEATTLVGEALKLFLDKFGLKTQDGLYLIAHYSSQAAPPDQETLQEKLKRIQFMTAGVINEFQGNVFDTREEAITFYLRLRQELFAKPQISPSGTRSIEHYEQCIHVSYEPRIDGISLIFTDTVITNAAEVDNVFAVCERKFKEVMRARGWKRVGWVADLGGYNLVGTEATTLVGEALKLFLDKFGLKTQDGLYLIAHYSSQAAPPDQETLQEKLKRIQFMTAGVINEFQGNVFDTREEAITFYLRLRQELFAIL